MGLIMKLQTVAEVKGLHFPPRCQVFSQEDHPPGSPCQQIYEEPAVFNSGCPGQARALAL